MDTVLFRSKCDKCRKNAPESFRMYVRKILICSSLLFLTGCGKNNEELLDAFLADEIPAYCSADGTDTVMRSDFPYNEEDFYSYSVGERIDLDNDGEREQIMNGPNGGVYFDARDGKVYILAQEEGMAGLLSYTYYDDAVWIVHSDVLHAGRQFYWLTKYDGDGNVVDKFTLSAEYWDSPDGTYDENSEFTYRDEKISMEEYEALWEEIFDAKEYTAANTAEGQYEPIFAKDSIGALDEEDSFAVDMRENYIYETWIAQETDIAIPSHYDSENGPLESDVTMYYPYERNDLPYQVVPAVYTYQDDRMDISITIEYPQISYREGEMEDAVNEKIREAFFYGYLGDEDGGWNPGRLMYASITRQYFITREDENYFSLRVYEYNDMRGANHPNEWETGIEMEE